MIFGGTIESHALKSKLTTLQGILSLDKYNARRSFFSELENDFDLYIYDNSKYADYGIHVLHLLLSSHYNFRLQKRERSRRISCSESCGLWMGR